MQLLGKLLDRAKTSKKYLWVLNRLMRYIVPFNRPHGFKVSYVGDDKVQTFAAYQKRNFNHVKGIHACALATIGELSAGLALMTHFSPQSYRLIMSSLTADYHYQAKKDITSTTEIPIDDLNLILAGLKQDGKYLQTVESILKDTDNQLVAIIKTTWQIKPWNTVKTKV